MSAASRQAYLNTRVSVMATRLLDPDAIAELSQLQLPELAERFDLPELQEPGSGRGKSRVIEQAFLGTLLQELTIIARPMAAPERAVVLAWIRKYALFNLKTLIRGKLHGLAPKEMLENLFELPSNLRLTSHDLFRTENVLEMLRQLESSPHSLIARQAREIYEQRREPFALEAAIDQRYYAELLRQVMQLQGEDHLPLRQLIGADLDRINLLWLLRYRFSYRLSPSEAFYQLVPSPRLMHRERLLALAEMETFEQLVDALPPPLGPLLQGSPNIIEVQRRLGRYFAGEARRILHQSLSGVARTLAYLMLREMDFALMFSVIQGRLLGLSTEVVEIALEMVEPTCPWSGTQTGSQLHGGNA